MQHPLPISLMLVDLQRRPVAVHGIYRPYCTRSVRLGIDDTGQSCLEAMSRNIWTLYIEKPSYIGLISADMKTMYIITECRQ